MADIKITWENFKGLELITDEFQYSVAKRLITNELGDISNGYMLSHAKRGESGWSFGGHQMDLSKNSEGVKLLKDIIMHQHGTSFWTPSLETALKSNDASLLSSSDKIKINNALSSDYGKEKINETF